MISQKFLSNDRPCNCFATPLRDATKFANVYHIIKIYSVLSNKNRHKNRRSLCILHPIIHEATSECGFVWTALEAARTRPAVLQTETAQESWLW